MTTEPIFLNPGCFGSTVFFRIDATECVSCPQMRFCATKVRSNEAKTRAEVSKLDRVFGTDKARSVERWFTSRWKHVARSQPSLHRIKATLQIWDEEDINPFLVKMHTNPVRRNGPLREIFNFILHQGPFKPRDLVEHLCDIKSTVSKAASERLVRDTCDALLSLGLLNKDGGVLCL